MDTPQWSLGDRLRKAMHHAGLTGQEMAERLQMNPTTISDYVNDRTTPRLETVQQWAAETGVSVWWIVDELPRLDSNQQPSDYQIGAAGGVARAEKAEAAIARVREACRGTNPDRRIVTNPDRLLAWDEAIASILRALDGDSPGAGRAGVAEQPSGLQIRTHLCPECLTEWQCAETDHDGHALCAQCAQVFA